MGKRYARVGGILDVLGIYRIWPNVSANRLNIVLSYLTSFPMSFNPISSTLSESHLKSQILPNGILLIVISICKRENIRTFCYIRPYISFRPQKGIDPQVTFTDFCLDFRIFSCSIPFFGGCLLGHRFASFLHRVLLRLLILFDSMLYLCLLGHFLYAMYMKLDS